ncbi:MAG: SlyX family protein, partial [Acetatifactor sp.]|nr:SlyX family protein [Acetatifactor sp.]
CRIAEYFNVSADYLLGLTTNSMPIDSLNVKLSDGYPVGSVLNSILELSQSSRQKMSKYLTMIKICEEMPQKEETINKQQALLRRQKHTIERLNQTVGQQAQEILRLKELLEEKNKILPKVFSEATDI